MQETKTATGSVDKMKMKTDGWAAKVNNEWYNKDGLLGDCPTIGQNIEVVYWVNPKSNFRNISEWRVLTSQPADRRERKIIKQSCLKAAATITATLVGRTKWNTKEIAKTTTELSDEFVKYVEQ